MPCPYHDLVAGPVNRRASIVEDVPSSFSGQRGSPTRTCPLSTHARRAHPLSIFQLSSPHLHCRINPKLRSPPAAVLVSPLSIPRRGSFPSSSSTRSPPHPASSPPLQGRSGRSSPFPAVRVTGEVRRLLPVAVRMLSPLRPAGPASSCRPALAAPPPLSPRACARASRRAVAAPTPRSRHRPCLDPAWVGASQWARPVGLWAGQIRVDLAILLGFH